MIVSTWQNKRVRLLGMLGAIDPQIAPRMRDLAQSWMDRYRISPHTVSEQGPTDEARVITAPESADVPDYLR